MSGFSTPCKSMFMLPMRSMVLSKSKPWKAWWWKCSRSAASRWGSSAGDSPLVSAAQRRQERNARQPSEASDLDRARRADEASTDPIDDARDASYDLAADVTDAAGARMDDPSRRTPSPAESAADPAQGDEAREFALSGALPATGGPGGFVMIGGMPGGRPGEPGGSSRRSWRHTRRCPTSTSTPPCWRDSPTS